METNQIEVCASCNKPLPSVGFFCSGCLTQFKCKSCEAFLEKDSIGCIFCGTPKDEQTSTNGKNTHNTFRYHEIITETSTERTIDGTYSDNVSKDFASVLINKLNGASTTTSDSLGKIPGKSQIKAVNDELIQDAEIIRDEKTKADSNIIPVSSTEYPTLKAIAMKNLPNSETEWIVVYAFYASNYGEKIFTREDLVNQYIESNRFNKETTRNGLSTNIKRAVVPSYINPLQTGYSMLDKGIEKAKEIISRTSGSSSKVNRKTTKPTKNQEDQTNEGKDKKERKTSSKGNKSIKRLTDIDFHPPGKDSLEVFYKSFSVKNDSEKNLLFVYYLLEILKVDKISIEHVYTCYDELNLRIPENMPQSIATTKNRTGWLETEDASNITVTVKGRNKIKFWDKKD